MESKKAKLIETETRVVVTMDLGGGGNGEIVAKEYKLPIRR